MKIIDEWKTLMGTYVYITDHNVRYIVNHTPCDSAGNQIPGVQSVEAYRVDPPRKLGVALVPVGTPTEKWDAAIRTAARTTRPVS